MSFKVGDVVWIYTAKSHDVKYKMCVIIAQGNADNSDSWLTSFICSQRTAPKHISKFYLLLKKDESTPYLEYDSFLNCWDPVEFSTKEISDSIARNKNNLCGRVSPECVDQMIRLVKDSPEVEMRKLLRYFE